MENIRLVFCTFPDAAVARQIGTALVGKQLAGCVNLLPGVESVYRWQGKVDSATEVLGIFKTSEAVFTEFERELAALHPYDEPEILAVKAAEVSDSYAAWLLGSLRAP